MDPYFLAVKYIFNKNKIENTDQNLNDFFTNGNSFSKFVAILFGIDIIPGTVISLNKFQIINNNNKALSYLGQNNPFFKSYQIDFYNEKNQISLIQLILSKVYFKVNRTTFLKKCNDFIQPKGLHISNFSEFVNGNGFMKLLNVVSNGSIPSEISANEDQLIEQITNYLKSLNISVIIDKSSLIPMNHDILMFQALIIIEHNNNDDISSSQNEVKENLTVNNESSSVQEKSTFETKIIKVTTNNNDDSQKQKEGNEKRVKINDEQNLNTKIDQESSNKIIDDNNENRITLNELHPAHISDVLDDEVTKSSEEVSDESGNLQSSELFDLPKSSYLNIVNNLMETNNQIGIMTFSDFEKGEILPKIVEILLKKKVPNIVDNPSGYDQMMNNMSSLYFINQNNPDFNPRNYNLTNENDLKDLIRILVKKYILTYEYVNQMKEETNQILHIYQKSINNFNRDWDDGINFAALLNFLSKGYTAFPPNEKLDIIKLKEMFVSANCPIILEDDSIFGKVDELAIQYQIKLILNEIKIKNVTIPKEENQLKKNNGNENKTNENDNSNEYIYEKNSSPIIRLFNLIGSKIGIHFDSFYDIINGSKIHIFAAHLIGIPNIPDTKNDGNYESKDNFKAVIKYLCENNQVFRYSLFNFDDESNINANIQWFATTLLEQYFLKESKKKIIKKAGEILGEKIFITEIKQVFLYGNGFYKILGEKDIPNSNYYDEDKLMKAFQKVDVPFIMDDDSLTNVNNDYICFQLELIFNKLYKPKETDKIKQKEKKEKFIFKLHFEPEDKTTEMDKMQMSDVLLNIGKMKKSSDNIEKQEKIPNESPIKPKKLIMQNIDQLTQFINQYEIIKKTEDHIKKLSEQKSKEIADIKENLKHVESKAPQEIKITNFEKQENKEDNNPDFPLSYDLYSYKSYIPIPEQINSNANENLSKMFKLTIADITNEMKSTDEKKAKMNYKPDKTLKSYRLFEYKDNEWKFNSMVWPKFVEDNLQKNDILYWILFTPSSTTDVNVENDQTYNLVKTITMMKTIESVLDSSIYVEILYGGNLKDIRNRFGIKTISTQNENIAFIQLRYPLSFKDTKVIDNMQSILTLQASYIISLYPKITIDESLCIINTSLHQAAQSSYFNDKSIGISFLMKNSPIPLEPEMKEIVHHPNFTKKLDQKLQNENEFFKNLQKSYEYAFVNINWIDISDYETYHHFLETMINFCQINFHEQCLLPQITNYLSFLKEIAPINDQKDMVNFMNRISLQFLPKEHISKKVFLKYTNGQIKYDQNVYNDFIKSNLINSEKDSLITILVINSNPQDYDFISRIISKTEFNRKEYDDGVLVDIKYCGVIENIVEQYNIKLKGKEKIAKSHLAMIFVNENESDRFNFKASLSSVCNLVITIANTDDIKHQTAKSIDLINAMSIYSSIYNTGFNHIFLIKDYLDYKKQKSYVNEMINSEYKRCFLDVFDKESCGLFLSDVFNLLTETNTNTYVTRFSKINIIDEFDLLVFKNIIMKKETIVYSIRNKEEFINSIERFYRKESSINDIINSINGHFMVFIFKTLNKKELNSFFIDLKRELTQKITEVFGNECIKQIKSNDFNWSEICQDVFDFINNSVTYLNLDYIQLLKEACRHEICNTIYNKVDSYSNENNIGNGLKYYIFNKLVSDFEKNIIDCLSKIDVTFMNTQLFEKEKVELTQEQIEQNSVKYILAVKESVKELTVEITTDEDIEKEIPRDY